MTYVTCRVTVKNRDQLRNPTLGNWLWATFTIFTTGDIFSFYFEQLHRYGNVNLYNFFGPPCNSSLNEGTGQATSDVKEIIGAPNAVPSPLTICWTQPTCMYACRRRRRLLHFVVHSIVFARIDRARESHQIYDICPRTLTPHWHRPHHTEPTTSNICPRTLS